MSETIELKVPDLGDFDDVEVIEILVAAGDEVAIEDSVLTLETDKASMDVPSTHAGKIISVKVAVGDKVSLGDLLLTLEVAEVAEESHDSTIVMEPAERDAAISAAATIIEVAAKPLSAADHSAELVVIGSGPGGYTAAFRAADLWL